MYLERGDVASAVPMIERALDLARTIEAVFIGLWSLTIRGAAHTLAGEVLQAIPLLERAWSRPPQARSSICTRTWQRGSARRTWRPVGSRTPGRR